MPPNFNDVAGPSPVNFVDGPEQKPGPPGGASSSSQSPALRASRSLTTLVAHMLIGMVVGANILFVFRNNLPLNTTNQHILLCVLGYQLLMAEAILCLAPDSWLSGLNLKHQRWVHWCLQIIGSALALAGSIIMALSKRNSVNAVNWNTLHGQFALVAMIFTGISLINGLTSMYAYQLRRVVPGILSRLTHICFGIVAMAAASISLAYGFDKGFFRNWATTWMADALIVMTGAFTTIVIINPCIVFYKKLVGSCTN